MAKIFRPHNDGDNTIRDWAGSSRYGKSVINQIKDPNGDSAQKEITSIPSPFARIDLVKTAFDKVNRLGVDGNTIHHKMVSDALDVGQIFFEFNKFGDDFEIITWNKQNDLNRLLYSQNEGQKLLGKTLQIFIGQDGQKYNFDRMDNIYLLNYKKGPNLINIIGATSPATLFFTSANNLSFVTPNIHFGNRDHPFDEEYAPLHERELEYQRFLHALSKTPQFSTLFPEVDTYILENFKLLDQNDQDALREITVNNYTTDFQDIAVDGIAGNTVHILNSIEMKQKIHNPVNIENNSGFLIQSNKKINNQTPLILPVEKYTKDTFYASGIWNPDTKVDYYNSHPIEGRVLPDDGTKYPYITISDFLSDSIISMPDIIDKSNFFDGNYNNTKGNKNISYLLPLTDLFFEFFTIEDLLTKTMNDGKLMFELTTNSGGITALLRIPIRNDYIEYRRIYIDNSEVSKDENLGRVVEKRFGLGVMPLVHYPDNVAKHYRVALFDKGQHRISLQFKDGAELVAVNQPVIRTEKELINNVTGVETYIVEESFDRIRIDVEDVAHGYLIPKFKRAVGREIYTFAVDFGTTNSHIEYVTTSNPNNPVPFDISTDEKQMHKLHQYGGDPDIRVGFEHNFIPETIGDEKDSYSFPMRTVFSYQKDTDFKQNPRPLAHGNIPFLYEKEATLKYNEIKTNLKWGSEEKEQRIMELHIESLFILMRNKVALNGGDLNATKIIWFYPVSMTKGRIDRFNRVWEKAYKKYFGDNIHNIISISESTAPYYYYISRRGAYPNIVTIDIGGGTTDIYVNQGDEHKMLQSFRFASDAIFGDGYNSDSDRNGFITKYLDELNSILNDGNYIQLGAALTQIEKLKRSSDITAFWFSLTGEKVNNNSSLDFLMKLSEDDHLRYVFIIFYASIFYFIAQTMKAKGLKRPLTIGFSGNGSHSLKVLSTNKDTIAKFAELIFNNVYDDETKGKIEIIMDDEPKKATCKGGIIKREQEDYEEIKKIKHIHLGDDFTKGESIEKTYAEISTEETKQKIVDSVIAFFDFLFKMDKKEKGFFNEYLAADKQVESLVKEICYGRTRLEQSLNLGLKMKKEEENDEKGETQVEETLFFYPLVGVLHELALKLGNYKA